MPRGMVVFGLVLGLVLAASWVSQFVAGSETTIKEFTLTAEPVPQASERRIWRHSPNLVERIDPRRLLQATVSAVHDKQFYILDWRDRSVKRFDVSGELQDVVGTESDEASGDSYPSDFDVSPSGDIYVAYRDLWTIRVFGAGGELLRSLRLPKSPHRVAVLNDSEFVVMTGEPDRHLFHRFSREGRLLSSFGNLVKGVQHPLPLDGWIASDDQGGIVFASFHSGLLARFEAVRGNRKFLVEGMKRGPLPSVTVGSSGRHRVKPGSPFYSLAVNVDGDRMYVLCERERIHDQRTLDVYDLGTGRYLWSTRPEESMSHAFVWEGLLYGGSSTQLGIWRLPESPAEGIAREVSR